MADLIVEVVESLGPRIQRGSEPNPPSVGHRDVDTTVVGDDPLDDLDNLIRFGDVGNEICTWADVESHHRCSCAAQGAACTGMQNGGMNPPTKCSDPASSSFAVCRCCKITP